MIGRIGGLGLLAGMMLVAGCGGGASSGAKDPVPSTGVFVDSPVSNIGYRTATQSGRTGADGSYRYLPGETVVFSIGQVVTPPMAAGPLLNPMMLFGANDVASDDRVVNLARLLQSLDDDGDPSNGITIREEAHSAATTPIDFGTAFEAEATPLLTTVGAATVGSPLPLVTPTDAVAHLAAQFALVGGWVNGTGSDAIAVAFLANGQYVMAHGGTADAAGAPGIEFGTYTYDATTGAWTASADLLDTNGEWGFSHPVAGVAATATGTATFAGADVTFDSAGGAFTMTRVVDAGSAIVGTWIDGTGTNAIVVSFLPDGTYAMAHGGVTDPVGQPGVEFGTYTWDSGTTAFTATASGLDTNGQWGFSHPYGNGPEPVVGTVTVTSTTLTLDDGAGGAWVGTRVGGS
jgi:hypothetical protein